MRKLYQGILKTFFYKHLVKLRASLNLTQTAMAQRLSMDVRSYIALDHGESCCSALTLSRYLIYCCNANAFLMDLRQAFEGATDAD